MSRVTVNGAGFPGLACARIISGGAPLELFNPRRREVMRFTKIPLLALAMLSAIPGLAATRQQNPFIGSWALTVPGGYAGWLGVEERDGKPCASIMWIGGSVL